MPIIKAAHNSTLLQHPVIDTKPTNTELHEDYGGYLLVGSDFY